MLTFHSREAWHALAVLCLLYKRYWWPTVEPDNCSMLQRADDPACM